jgi:DNA-binding GntR family transcriptional regulator
MFTVRRTPATSTKARRFSSSTTSMTLPGIARHISLTVYRRTSGACKALEAGGLLTSEMPVPQQREAIERHLMRDTAYFALCDAIVGGTLVPGETLRDTDLCDWLGLSRTPVRGALARLEDVGLIETEPQRFTRVTPLSADDARTLFPVLASLHALATELAVPVMERPDLARLQHENRLHIRALQNRDRAAAFLSDNGFHRVMVDRCGNPEIAHLLDRLEPRVRRLEMLSPSPLPGRRSLAQHEAIIARAARADGLRAASATRENWLELGAMIERSLAPA